MNNGKMTAAIAAAVALALPVAVPWGVASAQNATDQNATDQNQAQGTQAATAQNAGEGGALQEVVVTAERRAENLQTTPISVQVMNQDQLSQQDITHIKNLQLYTPSVSILDDGLYQAPSIRGIGNSAIIPNVTTGVAVLVDGLFTPEPHGLDEPFYDINDVETLRGPQGTFVGYSSTGGAIQITSNNPNFRGTNGYLELAVGNYTDKRVDGAINFTLSDTFAVRLAFNEEQMNSFYRDDGAEVIPGGSTPKGLPEGESPSNWFAGLQDDRPELALPGQLRNCSWFPDPGRWPQLKRSGADRRRHRPDRTPPRSPDQSQPVAPRTRFRGPMAGVQPVGADRRTDPRLCPFDGHRAVKGQSRGSVRRSAPTG